MISEFIILLPSFVVLGAFVGFCAGLLGIGGGLILVPSLYYLLTHFGTGIDESSAMRMALATSMAIIVPTGISSSWAQIKRKAVDWNVIRFMAPGLIVGVFVGVAVVSKTDSAALKYIFSIGVILIAMMMIFRKENEGIVPALQKPVFAYPTTFFFGVFAAMMGIGGAVFNVPYMNKSGISLKTCIACGSVLGVVISFMATIGYIIEGKGSLGYIHLMAFAMIVPLSMVLAPIGVRVSHGIDVKKLKIIFAGLLIIVAVQMFFETMH